MDAANPLCQWLSAALLAALIGCQTGDRSPTPTIRGQVAGSARPDPAPRPTLPSRPILTEFTHTCPLRRTWPAARCRDCPSPPARPTPAVKTAAGFTAVPTAAKAAELMKESVPQIKVVALVGASHLVTDQEVIEAVRQRLGEFRDLPGAARAAKEKELYAAELRRIIERELILDDMYAKLKKQGRLALADEIKGFAEKAAEQSLRRSAPATA